MENAIEFNQELATSLYQSTEKFPIDLEDAAMVLAIRAGQQPDIANADWLSSLAKKCRAFICRSELRNALENDSFAPVVEQLTAAKICPALLVMPVLLYVVKQGVDEFCQPLDPVV